MPSRAEVRARRQRGAAIAEFAVVALLVWVLLAGTLELGRAFAAQHLLQNAARATARALSLEAVEAETPFRSALTPGAETPFESAVSPGLFDPGFLVFDEELLERCDVAGFDDPAHAQEFEDFLGRLPLVNRLLRPLMIFEVTQGTRRLRYPGTLLLRDPPSGGFVGCASGSRYTVAVPRVIEGRIQWLPVVEEAPVSDPSTGSTLSFALEDGGWSSLRIHYPFQAAALVSWVDTAQTNPRTGRPLQRPEEVTALDVTPPTGTQLDASLDAESGSPGLVNPYAGSLGLGRVHVLGREVRPYRRVLSATAAFRREVFL